MATALVTSFSPSFLYFPKEYWRKIWSSNPLERLDKEIKRYRTHVVGFFPNDAAIQRLVGSYLFYDNSMTKILEPEDLLELAEGDPPASRRQPSAVAHQYNARSIQNSSIDH